MNPFERELELKTKYLFEAFGAFSAATIGSLGAALVNAVVKLPILELVAVLFGISFFVALGNPNIYLEQVELSERFDQGGTFARSESFNKGFLVSIVLYIFVGLALLFVEMSGL